MLFINFSSAFNFIQPYFLAQRLLSDFNVAVSQPTYFLTTRSHRVGLMYLVGAHHPLDPFGVVCFHRFYLFYLLIKVRAVRSRIIVRCVDDSVIIFSAGSGALSQSQSLINLTGITGDIIMKMQLNPKEMIVYFWIGPLPFVSEPPLIKVKFFSASFFLFQGTCNVFM